MEFQELGKKEREILLKALEFDIHNLTCEHCMKKVLFDKCCIMPPIDKESSNATILCSSPVCVSWYLTIMEE